MNIPIFVKRLICSIVGHRKSEPFLTETSDMITTTRCKFCKSPTTIGQFGYVSSPSIPSWVNTPEKKKKWDDYLESSNQSLRDSVKK